MKKVGDARGMNATKGCDPGNMDQRQTQRGRGSPRDRASVAEGRDIVRMRERTLNENQQVCARMARITIRVPNSFDLNSCIACRARSHFTDDPCATCGCLTSSLLPMLDPAEAFFQLDSIIHVNITSQPLHPPSAAPSIT